MKAYIELHGKKGLGLSQRVQQAPYIVKHTKTPNTWAAESNTLFGTQIYVFTHSYQNEENPVDCAVKAKSKLKVFKGNVERRRCQDFSKHPQDGGSTT